MVHYVRVGWDDDAESAKYAGVGICELVICWRKVAMQDAGECRNEMECKMRGDAEMCNASSIGNLNSGGVRGGSTVK